MSLSIKICGINSAESAQTCISYPITKYLGFIFYEKSPRYVSIKKATQIINLLPESIKTVAVMVNPQDQFIEKLLNSCKFNILQLHGSETPKRIKEIKKNIKNISASSIMKVIRISKIDHLTNIKDYENVSDMLLFDSIPPKDGLPGGNALKFNWEILSKQSFKIPFMLSGGINNENISEAVRITGAKIIDVSSGVEDEPGKKSLPKIKNFLKTAQSL